MGHLAYALVRQVSRALLRVGQLADPLLRSHLSGARLIHSLPPTPPAAPAVAGITSAAPAVAGITFTACQKEALRRLRVFQLGAKKYFVLAGSAGTGKTFLLDHFLASGTGRSRYLLVKLAPTHKARLVLQRSLVKHGREARTIASFFQLKPVTNPITLDEEFLPAGKWNPYHNETGSLLEDLPGLESLYTWKYVKSAPPEVTIISEARKDGKNVLLFLIDEVSMVAKENHNELLKVQEAVALALPGSKMILVGDDKQLPPVKEPHSLFFGDAFLQHKDVDSCELREVVRTSDETIKQNLEYMRDCIERGVSIHPKNFKYGDNFVRCEDLTPYFQEFKSAHSVRVLAWRNMTVDEYNLEVKACLTGVRSTDPGPGDIVVFTRPYASPRPERIKINNTENARVLEVAEVNHVHSSSNAAVPKTLLLLMYRMLSDDAVGVNGKPKEFLAYKFKDPKEFTKLMKDFKRRYKLETNVAKRKAMRDGELEDLRSYNAAFKLCFAQTVHKSQGETIDVVLVDGEDLLSCFDKTMRNRLLYTAVSRTRVKLIIKLTTKPSIH